MSGLARANRPTAAGIEMIIVLFTATPIFSLASPICPAASIEATEGIIAAAIADANAIGILEIVCAIPEKIP